MIDAVPLAGACEARARYIDTAAGKAVIFIREPNPGEIHDFTCMLSDIESGRYDANYIKDKLK